MTTIELPSRNGVKAIPRGRPFVNTKQRFIALFATDKSVANVAMTLCLALSCALALSILAIISMASELAQRQVVIVGETTAKQLVPLWPNGVGTTVCDASCIEGSLQAWLSDFRTITGEQDGVQIEQHKAQERAATFIANGSPAATVVRQYEQRYNPYALAAKGLRLDVMQARVDADRTQANRYNAEWEDVVTDVRTHKVIGRHKFAAQIDATANPGSRTEQSIASNPVGVMISDLHLWGDQ